MLEFYVSMTSFRPTISILLHASPAPNDSSSTSQIRHSNDPKNPTRGVQFYEFDLAPDSGRFRICLCIEERTPSLERAAPTPPHFSTGINPHVAPGWHSLCSVNTKRHFRDNSYGISCIWAPLICVKKTAIALGRSTGQTFRGLWWKCVSTTWTAVKRARAS